jgi:hypothetical protein
MPDAILIINQPGQAEREERITDATAIGRATDNLIILENDQNVAFHHALIKARDEGFWLYNLVSSRLTKVNGEPVTIEQQLRDGDLISLGGTTFIDFRADGVSTNKAEPGRDTSSAGGGTGPASAIGPAGGATGLSGGGGRPAGLSGWYIALAIASVMALVIVAFVVGGSLLRRETCHATARIISPQPGETIQQPVEVVVDTRQNQCIERLRYQLNGIEFASVETPPYTVTLDPARLLNLSGESHVLTVTVESRDGQKEVQPDEVLLAFNLSGPQPNPLPPVVTSPSEAPTTADNAGDSSTVDTAKIQDMSRTLATQISSKNGYVFDSDLANLIRARTVNYLHGGYTARARLYRHDVNKAFSDVGLKPLYGYVTAMSRSQFNEKNNAGGTVLWQLPIPLAKGYLSADETEAAFLNPKRSAEITSAYMKALIFLFKEEDFMYAIACFGKPLSEASDLLLELNKRAPDPAARRDFGKMVKSNIVTPEQLHRVVDFFAAGIVGENPEVFGLKSEKHFSDL